MSVFAELLICWQKCHGRRHLPWQGTDDPYAVWLSEVMLQQTQVNTVIPYYQRFIRRFPSIKILAQSPLDDVLAAWSGLGYYSRGRNLHRAACRIMTDYQGVFPQSRESIQQLPGIGRSTAAAIAVFAFGQREAIMDGNAKRVFVRYFGIRNYPGEPKTLKQLWELAEQSLPETNHGDDIQVYTQGLMDLGALVCLRRNPLCGQCPVQDTCAAYRENCVAQLPVPKPSKPLPEKQTVFLIYTTKNKLLLEKRPSKGIWGGLWCFPEETGDADRSIALNHGQRVDLPPLMHTFTHYRLWINPQRIEIDRVHEQSEKTVIWIEPEKALELAIPVPVKKLIQQHFLGNTRPNGRLEDVAATTTQTDHC
ncbi:MAG: A/G-specific adenine glycosylase [Nitrosomonas sp.]|nr:A/G-specific adenine glycosylase [Nitrosomonas sp.]